MERPWISSRLGTGSATVCPSKSCEIEFSIWRKAPL